MAARPALPNLAAHVSADGILAVRVTPKASAARIVVEDGDEGARVRVYVTTAPEDGKANAAVEALVARSLGIPKSSVSVVRGATSREKLLRIAR